MKTSPFSEESTNITPREFEKEVKKLFSIKENKYKLIEIIHDKKIQNEDQEYQIDIYYEFEQADFSFKVLVECKRHKGAVSRELIQVLNDKLTETGTHKGILVSTSGFQKGAISYARRKGIALVRIVRGEMLYEPKGRPQTEVDLEDITELVDMPDFSFLQIRQNGENSDSNTLLEDDHQRRFLNEIKTWHNKK